MSMIFSPVRKVQNISLISKRALGENKVADRESKVTASGNGLREKGFRAPVPSERMCTAVMPFLTQHHQLTW